MDKSNKDPELATFTLLNPEFHGVAENRIMHKRENKGGLEEEGSNVDDE